MEQRKLDFEAEVFGQHRFEQTADFLQWLETYQQADVPAFCSSRQASEFGSNEPCREQACAHLYADGDPVPGGWICEAHLRSFGDEVRKNADMFRAWTWSGVAEAWADRAVRRNRRT